MSELPLFLLHTVLFPGGRCRLRVFEKRYMDMVSTCLKTQQPFGICLIRTGTEVGEAAWPYAVGTAAHVVEWDMLQAGILGISVRGGRRFHVDHTHVQPDALIVGEVQFLPDEPATPLSATHQRLSELLALIINEVGEQYYFPPAKLDDAAWVAYRLAEFLPVQNRLRQDLLEESDPLKRLDMVAVAIDAVQAGHG